MKVIGTIGEPHEAETGTAVTVDLGIDQSRIENQGNPNVVYQDIAAEAPPVSYFAACSLCVRRRSAVSLRPARNALMLRVA